MCPSLPEKLSYIINLIGSGIPVITVNKRLSRYLLGQFESVMRVSARASWRTPLMMPLSAWVRELWEGNCSDASFLSEPRAFALWKKIVAGDGYVVNRDVVFTHDTARTAFDAYKLIKEYRLSSLGDDIYLTDEALAFKRWMAEYEDEVKRLCFMDYDLIRGSVIKLIRRGEVKIPEKIVLAGFDELTPSTSFLLQSIRENGGQLIFWPFEPLLPGQMPPNDMPDLAGEIHIRRYEDEVAEVRQAARWVRINMTPGVKIGFVVPDLERYRTLIDREFSAEFDPASVLPWSGSRRLFNISLAEPLNHLPLIKSALQIISFDLERQPINTVSSILLSPFFPVDETEYFALADFDFHLRESGISEIGLSGLICRLDSASGNGLSAFKERLRTWREELTVTPVKDFPARWAEHFALLLESLSWPSRGIKLTNNEYQSLDAWKEMLNQFASLNEITGRMNRSEAISNLTMMAKDTLHQPESIESPVQVLGILESGGLFFDHIWMMGAHEDAFPGISSPNPFIPAWLQKRFNLPSSSPDRVLSFARVALRRLLLSASSFTISYPQRIEEKDVAIGLLLRGLSDIEEEEQNHKSSRLRDSVHALYSVDILHDDRPVPVSVKELGFIRGGTGIIRDQSECPFRAFARYRLSACGPEDPQFGFDSRERGIILHEALKLFWRRVKGLKRLQEIAGQNRLEEELLLTAEEAVKKGFRSDLPEMYMELEKERVRILLAEWVELEMQRSDFMVEQTECKEEIDVGGLTISVRIDRIDRLGTGERVIIDYKTGKCKRRFWLTDRPREPQIPLYSLSGSFDAVAYASVRPLNPLFEGFAREGDILPGVGPFATDPLRRDMAGVEGWGDLIETWKRVLYDIAESFCRGCSTVEPNGYLKWVRDPCRFCDFALLCRKFEHDIDTDEYGED